MIPIYTQYDLSMNVCGEKYFLPFDVFGEDKDDEIIEKTIKLFSDADIYERKLYESMLKKPSVSYDQKYNEININCLYEGNDDYYAFTIKLEVFCLDCEKGKYLVALICEHEYSGLLDELIDIKTIPLIISSTNLKKY
jgi:hypothetical protein